MTPEQLSRLSRHINGGHSYAKIYYDSIFDRLDFYHTTGHRASLPDDFELNGYIKAERGDSYTITGAYNFNISDMHDISEVYEGAKERLLDLWTEPLIAKKWIDLLRRNCEKLPAFNFWEHI